MTDVEKLRKRRERAARNLRRAIRLYTDASLAEIAADLRPVLPAVARVCVGSALDWDDIDLLSLVDASGEECVERGDTRLGEYLAADVGTELEHLVELGGVDPYQLSEDDNHLYLDLPQPGAGANKRTRRWV